MTKNRNPVKQFFITFPKSNVDKQSFRDVLLRFDPDYYKLCEEKHKDGTPHLHAIIRTKNKYSKAFVLKYLKEIYPDDYKRIDIETVRSIKNALQYLSKEDPNPLESGEYIDNRKPQQNVYNKISRSLGYKNVEELMLSISKHKSYMESMRVLIRAELDEMSFVYGTTHEIYLRSIMDDYGYEDSQKIERFIQMNETKDDITFLSKVLSIKYEETTRR